MKYDNLLHRLRTPVETINILGCGGIKMGTIVECWGPPGGGKSTFCYQTGAYFKEDYSDGILHLLDAENSYDSVRLSHVFGINVEDENFIVDPAPTIEDAFEKIVARINIAKEKQVPYLGIIDSWTVLNTKSAMENVESNIKDSKNELSMNSGGMMYKARAGRHWLNLLMPRMYESPITLLLINQATSEITRYGASVGSGGGYGLKHDIQFSMSFTKKDTLTDGDVKLGFLEAKEALSEVDITKSKFIPEIKGIPIYINTALGGKITSSKELIDLARAKGLIKQSGGWYKLDGKDKNYRLSEIEEMEGLSDLLKAKLTEDYRSKYMLVDLYYKEKEKRKNAAIT